MSKRANNPAGAPAGTRLCDGEIHQEGVVTQLATGDEAEIRKLMAMGVLPGCSLRLIRRFPSYVFQLGHSQFAIDRHLAEVILMNWQPAPSISPGRHRHRHGQH